MNGESANKFISALVKSLQTLCHGYVDFNDGIEIIGHLYLNIDSGSSFDYIVKEKVCKNAESGTIFVSKSFQAHSPPGQVISRRDKDDEIVFEDSSMSPTTGTHRIQSAITNISNVLSGQPGQKHTAHQLSANSGKRKRDHGGTYNLQQPYKYTTLQSSSSSGYFNSGSKQGGRNHSEHFSSSSHAEFFGSDSNQGSGMAADDEDDLDLDVTFVKDEYQRNSSQRGVASRLSQDQASSQSNMLHEGQLNYPPNHSQAPQQFASGTAGELSGISQNFQDPSQLDINQHPTQGPPNPRSDAGTSQQTDQLLEESSPVPSILEQMKGVSDTLQLGIRLFGPKFMEDLTSGCFEEQSRTSKLVNDQSGEQSSISVFPEMLVSGDKNYLWQTKESKADGSDYEVACNMSLFTKKNSDQDKFTAPVLKEVYGTSCKRRRGRPPKNSSPQHLASTSVEGQKASSGSEGDSSRKSSDSAHKDIALKCGMLSKRVRGSYGQYSPADKLEIIEFGIKNGSTAASRKYNIPESTVRSWSKKMDKFIKLVNESEAEVMTLPLNLEDSTKDVIKQTESQLTKKWTCLKAS
ncbi:hypothetical protein PoB_004012200 [Plakobranchus ocellatus]|uniref:HTH psq-type domain-containing protein n=1 Tax=Plakobranchus ocellatus TaxID=259542 RepID=A0AAV4B328_9GAST|nr:hypothetical protein PoB_004012200 [Plakobranchus ocellatus]